MRVMTMQMNARCIACQIARLEQRIRSDFNENEKMDILQDVFQLILNTPNASTLAYLNMRIDAALKARNQALVPDYRDVKQYYNAKLLERLPVLKAKVLSMPDPLYASLQLARAGNYIDFGAMQSVSDSRLDELLEQAFDDPLDTDTYQIFQTQCENSRTLIYCMDNCGEIVLDMLAIQLLQQQYPHLQISAMVRGKPVLNDASMEDVIQIGLDQLCEIRTNEAAMAGIDIYHLSEQTRNWFTSADMIISKGQGNFESLCGCGLPIYYLLLCKCSMFSDRFGMKMYQGVFHKEA